MHVGKLDEKLSNDATPSGMIDHTKLTTPELIDIAPYYVLRLLCGSHVFQPWGSATCELRSCGQTFHLTNKSYESLARVAKRVKDQIEFQGTKLGNAEDIIRAMHAAKRFAPAEMMVPEHKLRVLFLCSNESGCGFYRSIQPYQWLRCLSNSPVWVEMTDYLSLTSAMGFDMLIAPRFGALNIVSMLQGVLNMGRMVVYETDDLLSDIPSWNPAREHFPAGDEMRRAHLIRNATACIVSTEELSVSLGRPDVTHVCHNGIDPGFWPLAGPDQNTDQVRVLWAGSDTHECDLKLVVPVIKRLIQRYKDRVKFVFVGYVPDEFRWIYNDTARSKWGIRPEYAKHMEFHQGCSVYDWPRYLADRKCHMAIAPLVSHPFNEAKSELKVLEAWALGIPIVASRIAPYQRAIQHNHDGLLADSEGSWDAHIDHLLRYPDERRRMGQAGVRSLNAKGYLMEQVVLDYERALLRIARGKTEREACNIAIEARLKEIGGV